MKTTERMRFEPIDDRRVRVITDNGCETVLHVVPEGVFGEKRSMTTAKERKAEAVDAAAEVKADAKIAATKLFDDSWMKNTTNLVIALATLIGVLTSSLAAWQASRAKEVTEVNAAVIVGVKAASDDHTAALTTVKKVAEDEKIIAGKSLQLLEATHTLVNSNMGAQLILTAKVTRRLATLTKDEVDIKAAEIAESLLREHEKKQAIVDAGAKTPISSDPKPKLKPNSAPAAVPKASPDGSGSVRQPARWPLVLAT